MSHAFSNQTEALHRLRSLPFVKKLHYTRAHDGRDTGFHGEIEIQTPVGSHYLLVEEKRSYLSRPEVKQLLGWLNHRRTNQDTSIILLARHIPRQAAEALIESNAN